MPWQPPTQTQQDMLHEIRRLRRRSGFVPTFRQLGRALGHSSTNAVSEVFQRLYRKGFIATEPAPCGVRRCHGYVAGYVDYDARSGVAVLPPQRCQCGCVVFSGVRCPACAGIFKEAA